MINGKIRFDIGLGHGTVSSKGTELMIWVDPRIEEFVRSLGDGSSKPLPGGHLWYPIRPVEQEIYAIGNGELPVPEFEGYALDQTNKGLLLEDNVINLSFLRLRGISIPGGLVFGMKTIMSPDLMHAMKTKIGRAVRALCRDFIVPVTVRLVIVDPDADTKW